MRFAGTDAKLYLNKGTRDDPKWIQITAAPIVSLSPLPSFIPLSQAWRIRRRGQRLTPQQRCERNRRRNALSLRRRHNRQAARSRKRNRT